ncbi:Uma2 family endonuclease [Nocardia lijiangensis]|uniref:Uma2 family endonuclease n=1 Tax=Nocardia lijiangensis TaxID=299618 RepID=UPI0008374126|nr:Uma2 family endonuclease [Nocardia lijiangensis]
MTEASIAYHWSRDEFLRAWQAGAFDRRVELVEGEVWSVVIGGWHGEAVFRVAAALRSSQFKVSGATLPTEDSLPDPDCWVRRVDAEPIDVVGKKIPVWAPEDISLVVEVSDETVVPDLNVKANLYSRGGYPVYWVVTRELIYEHTEPTPRGYANVRKFLPGELIPLHFADTAVAVEDILFEE